jgi:hypothetical protein
MDSNVNKELVIAAYDKDLSWLSELNKDVKVTVYRKGDLMHTDGEIVVTPNAGRCVHTFFRHLYVNYDNLADITFFAQDYPFDHWEDIVDVINNNRMSERCQLQIGGYYGFHYNTIQFPSEKGGVMWNLYLSLHHDSGKILSCSSNGHPQDSNPKIDVNKYWKLIFTNEIPDGVGRYEFMPGGHFGITKEHVHLRSREVYKQVVEFLEEDETAPWMIERLECYIFNPKYKTKL